jgi:beta-catenin-like protein 1
MGNELDEDELEMFYLRRLESGLFTLQTIDFILAWLIMEDDGVCCPFYLSPLPFFLLTQHALFQAKDQATLLLSRKDQTLQEIVDVLQEQHDNVGSSSEDGDPAAESQRVILEGLMTYLKGLV